VAIEPTSSSTITPAPPDRPHKRLVVWLVHGTWPRGVFSAKWPATSPTGRPIWSQSGSAFNDDLKDQLSAHGFDAEIVPYVWSGANSALERDEAARSLAIRLQEEADKGALNVVVGHSHGGNVALTAAAQYVTKPIEILVATLATPFIDLHPKAAKGEDGYGQAMDRIHKEQLAKMTMAAFLVSSLMVLAARSFVSDDLAAWVLLITNALLAITFSNFYGRHGDLLDKVPPPYARMVWTATVRLLVLRGIDDEAALALAAAAIQSLVTKRLARVVVVLIGVLGGVFGVAILMYLVRVRGDGYPEVLGWFDASIGAYLAISLLYAGGRSVAGREFFFTGQIYDVNVNSAPDIVGDITIRTLAGQRGQKVTRFHQVGVRQITPYSYGRRHSLYENKDCIEQLVTWVGEQTHRD
jgi:hypothetical protein